MTMLNSMLFLLLSISPDDAQLIETAKTAAREWRRSFTSVRFQMVVEPDPNGKVARDSNSVGARAQIHKDWTWTENGDYRQLTTFVRDGNSEPGDQIYVNKRKGEATKLSFGDKNNPQKPLTARLWKPTGAKPRGDLIITAIRGLWFNKEGTWFADLLDRAKEVRVIKEGAQSFVEFDFDLRGGILDRLRLDPEHGFLPCSLILGGDWEYKVGEWERVEDGRWSPKSGTFSKGLNTGKITDVDQWRIEKAEYNLKTGDGYFDAPAYPDGTLVEDLTTGRPYVKGKSRKTSSLQELGSNAVQQNTGHEAITPFTNRVVYSIVALCVAAAAVVLGWKRMARHVSQSF